MRDKNQIITYTRIDMDPFSPKQSDIDIRDIAHALSLLCRANGHISHFYSVGQHCLNCEREAAARGCDTAVRAYCLLHDATECYISDLTRPVKRRFPLYYEAEERLADVIYLSLTGRVPNDEELKAVSEIDDCMLYHEFIALADVKMFDEEPRRTAEPDFSFRSPDDVEKEFLARFDELIGRMKNG